ncbi:hypothetical protein QQF54_12545 [Lelliottia sp. V106_10]|uniref:hypothetical protein n=1 Tax=Lelliottia wanjuensis TaxID=3050585 RepID=UPI00254C0AAF|nr:MULTISPECIES: hypothetical protein [unclassified Lelliottia]MDK9358049.1 hypothetical protein [Lelliottia sp. V106_16]MDK9374177.1 hypothetical protein [Lelliottia sp. V106_10]MDK9600731.1 hypothetical protein [Lelliottia sp. V106_5]
MKYKNCRLNIFKGVFLFLILCANSSAQSLCKGMVTELNVSEKITLENNVKRQLKVDGVNVIKFFKDKGSSIAYIETFDADEVFLFYSGDELKSDYISMWSGAAGISEQKTIEEWARKNVPGIPYELAKCFSWYAIYRKAE